MSGILWREEWRYGNQTEALNLGESLLHHPAAAPLQRVTFSALLGRDYVTLGKHDRAERLLEQLEAEGKELRDTRGPHQVAVTKIYTEDLRAMLRQVQGDPEGALAAIRRAIEASHAEVERSRAAAGSSRTDLEYDSAIRTRNGVMVTAVWLYFTQGRNEEAEGLARLGLKLAAEERTGGGTEGFWHRKLALALLGERRFEEAVAAANEALAVLRANGAVESSLLVVQTQSYLMQALFGLERWADSDRLATEMHTATTDDATAREMADHPMLQVFLHLKNGRLSQARERIDGVVRYRQRNYGERSRSTIEARALRVLVLQAQGAERLALEDYRAVLEYVFAPESPFDATKARWLVREAALNQIATAAAFRALRDSRRRAKPERAFFGFGDPLFKTASAPAGGAVTTGTSWKPGCGLKPVKQAPDYGALSALPETREEMPRPLGRIRRGMSGSAPRPLARQP
jgi:tetratricopeptide (TPR) repeat protein